MFSICTSLHSLFLPNFSLYYSLVHAILIFSNVLLECFMLCGFAGVNSWCSFSEVYRRAGHQTSYCLTLFIHLYCSVPRLWTLFLWPCIRCPRRFEIVHTLSAPLAWQQPWHHQDLISHSHRRGASLADWYSFHSTNESLHTLADFDMADLYASGSQKIIYIGPRKPSSLHASD